MQIDCNILFSYGGVAKKYDKGRIIFWEGNMPNFFYQVIEGEIKVFSANAEGKELILGLFKQGESFGEPSLLLNRPYPNTALATTNSTVIRISKEKLLSIMNDYPEITRRLVFTFAERMYNKAAIAQMLISHTPCEKILSFFRRIKGTEKQRMMVPFTRQQIADFTGLRVETVIRTLMRMNSENKISIIKHKVYF